MSSIIYDNPQWSPQGENSPFYLQPLSNNEHRQFLYYTIDTNIGEVIETLKEIFPQDRTKGSTFLAAQNLLPQTELATEAEVHQWAGTFSQYANNGKYIMRFSHILSLSRGTSTRNRNWRSSRARTAEDHTLVTLDTPYHPKHSST